MKWIPLENEAQLDLLIKQSQSEACIIFKHSTRCPISAMAKGRIDRHEPSEGLNFYYLDLIAYRELSDKIAALFHVKHESPQVLLIKNGECVYEESHNGIDFEELAELAAN